MIKTRSIKSAIFAKAQYDLIVWSFLLMSLIIAIVFILFTVILIRYREKPENMDYEPPEQHGNTLLEIIWTLVPVIIVIALSIPTVKATYASEEVRKSPNILNQLKFMLHLQTGNGYSVTQRKKLKPLTI